MAFTFSVKEWENSRPTKAKGSGVAKGITAVNAACRKKANAMNQDEVDAAAKALQELVTAFDTASGKLRGQRDNKAITTSMAITGWRKECTDFQDELKKRLYALRLNKFLDEFNRLYVENRDKLLRAHAAASGAHQQLARGGAAPDNKLIMDWFNAARDTAKFVSKTEIQKLQVTGIPKGIINIADVPLPGDVNSVKTKIKELNAWCDEFAKGAKRTGRAAGAGLSDTDAVEKELKAILAEYAKVEQAMKPIIQRAVQMATLAKQKTDQMKVIVQANNTDERAIKPVATDLRNLKAEVDRLDESVRTVNHTYRESTGDTAKRAAAWRKMAGYDAARHGPILQKRQEAAFMGIRRATVPLAETRKQIERAKNLMSKSTNHRGYANAL